MLSIRGLLQEAEDREQEESGLPDPEKSLPGRRGLRMAQEKEFDLKGRREVVQKEGLT